MTLRRSCSIALLAALALGLLAVPAAAAPPPGPAVVSFKSMKFSEHSRTYRKITAKLSHKTNVDVTVRWETADGTAVAREDYAENHSDAVTIFAGKTQATVLVLIFDDKVVEPDETFLVRPTAVLLGDAVLGNAAVITIKNDDH